MAASVVAVVVVVATLAGIPRGSVNASDRADGGLIEDRQNKAPIRRPKAGNLPRSRRLRLRRTTLCAA